MADGPHTAGERDVVRTLVCVECGCVSGLRALGWRGYRIDAEEDDEPAVAFYCPACAARAFD